MNANCLNCEIYLAGQVCDPTCSNIEEIYAIEHQKELQTFFTKHVNLCVNCPCKYEDGDCEASYEGELSEGCLIMKLWHKEERINDWICNHQ